MQLSPLVEMLHLYPESAVPHISLVFREMWDTTDVDRKVHRMNRESEGKSIGIPHLAKNERGAPVLCEGMRGRSCGTELISACFYSNRRDDEL